MAGKIEPLLSSQQCGKQKTVIPATALTDTPSPVHNRQQPYTLQCGRMKGHDAHTNPRSERYHFDTVRQQGWHPPVERFLE